MGPGNVRAVCPRMRPGNTRRTDGVGLGNARAVVLNRGREVGNELCDVLGRARLAVRVHLLVLDAGALEHAARARGVGGGGEGVEGDGHGPACVRARCAGVARSVHLSKHSEVFGDVAKGEETRKDDSASPPLNFTLKPASRNHQRIHPLFDYCLRVPDHSLNQLVTRGYVVDEPHHDSRAPHARVRVAGFLEAFAVVLA
jgi:hypothetical protein